MQAIEFWEKSAQEAMDSGLDPAGALKWFGKADDLAETLSTYFRRNRPMSVWMIPRPGGLSEGELQGTSPSSPGTASAPMQLGPLPPSEIMDPSAPPLAGAGTASAQSAPALEHCLVRSW